MQNHEVEQLVLGTILADHRAAHFVSMLEVEDFDHPKHQLIFQAVALLAAEGRATPPVIIGPQFVGDMIDGAPVPAYIAKLAADRCVERDRLPDYIRALKELRGRRMMSIAGLQIAEMSAAASVPIGPFLRDIMDQFDVVLSDMRRQRLTSESSGVWAKKMLDEVEGNDAPIYVRTGLPKLDEQMGGWPRGELSVVAGRPSMGKSTVALSSARQAALVGVNSVLFSMEMSGKAVSARLLSDAVWNSQTPIEYERILARKLQEYEMVRLRLAEQKLAERPLEVDDQSSLTVSDVGVRARRIADRLERDGKRLDALWIDQLSFLRSSDRYRGNRVLEVGEITRALKAVAKELDVALILLCQLNRQNEQRDDKRPQLSDLRDSGNIEEDADTVLFCYRHAYYLERSGAHKDPDKESIRQSKIEEYKNILELYCAKRRNGPIFNQKFDAFMGSNAIRNLRA